MQKLWQGSAAGDPAPRPVPRSGARLVRSQESPKQIVQAYRLRWRRLRPRLQMLDPSSRTPMMIVATVHDSSTEARAVQSRTPSRLFRRLRALVREGWPVYLAPKALSTSASEPRFVADCTHEKKLGPSDKTDFSLRLAFPRAELNPIRMQRSSWAELQRFP